MQKQYITEEIEKIIQNKELIKDLDPEFVMDCLTNTDLQHELIQLYKKGHYTIDQITILIDMLIMKDFRQQGYYYIKVESFINLLITVFKRSYQFNSYKPPTDDFKIVSEKFFQLLVKMSKEKFSSIFLEQTRSCIHDEGCLEIKTMIDNAFLKLEKLELEKQLENF